MFVVNCCETAMMYAFIACMGLITKARGANGGTWLCLSIKSINFVRLVSVDILMQNYYHSDRIVPKSHFSD